MKSIKTKLIFLAIILSGIFVLAKSSQAATYYVSTDGNDSRATVQAQNIATPWQTLQKAANSVVAGDTVFIRAGRYAGFIPADKHGTEEARITFSGYQDEEVVIEGAVSVTGWSLHSGAIYVADFTSTYLSVIPKPEQYTEYNGFVNVDRIFDFKHWLEPKTSVAEMTAGSWYYDEAGKLLYVWLADSSNPSDHDIFSVASYLGCHPIWIVRCSYWTFRKMKVQLACFGINTAAKNESHHLIFDDIETTGCQAGIVPERASHDITIQNSYVHHTEGVGIQINSDSSTVENSEIAHTAMCRPWITWAGIAVIMNGYNNKCVRNYIHDIDSYGVFIEAWGIESPGQEYGYRNIVSNNKIENVTSSGVACSGCDEGTFAGNIIFNSNTCMTFEGGGVAGGMLPDQKLAYNNVIYNNTCVECNNGFTISDSVRNLAIRNNIVANTPFTIGAWNIAAKDHYISDYNNFYLGASGTFRWNGVTYNALATYQMASGQDIHSIGTDPLFVSSSDFHLQFSSPAINAGTDVGLTSDFDGHPIIGAPDIGAYEYQGASDIISPGKPGGLVAR